MRTFVSICLGVVVCVLGGCINGTHDDGKLYVGLARAFGSDAPYEVSGLQNRSQIEPRLSIDGPKMGLSPADFETPWDPRESVRFVVGTSGDISLYEPREVQSHASRVVAKFVLGKPWPVGLRKGKPVKYTFEVWIYGRPKSPNQYLRQTEQGKSGDQ